MQSPPSDHATGTRTTTLLELLADEKLDDPHQPHNTSTSTGSKWSSLKQRLGLRSLTWCGPGTWHHDDGDDVAAAEEERDDRVCCVCMGRKKGAAMIPCGHTYCRVCCRELWRQRGSCPLCNRLVLDILYIY